MDELEKTPGNSELEVLPNFVRDVAARNFNVNLNIDNVAKLCEGERLFCELCGAGFDLWPIRDWASHFIHAHEMDITVQNHDAVARLCTDQLTQDTWQWFSLEFMKRVTLRKRAWKAGLIEFRDGQGPRIVV